MLVGIGPGSTEHMTARARAAIAEADTIIGYVTYIKLVADLIEGKEIVRKSMTEELDRAIEALERARQGKKVALISSGDAGVYGMAGPTFEVLFQAGWTPPVLDAHGVPEPGGIEVEVTGVAAAAGDAAATERRATCDRPGCCRKNRRGRMGWRRCRRGSSLDAGHSRRSTARARQPPG